MSNKWWVHIIGPDDIEGPYESMDTAVAVAHQVNTHIAQRIALNGVSEFTPLVWAVPCQPGSPETEHISDNADEPHDG